ncbi:MAG: hypothetical protein ACXV3A_03810 [Kineosporiaceae bacterium]
MADLELVGPLDLLGTLDLAGQGGAVLVGGARALVEGASTTSAPPVLIPPPPASPADASTSVEVKKSLIAMITAGGKTIVATGLVLQGQTWPGMVTPSQVNAAPMAVTANGLPVNVKGDTATIFPTGTPVPLTTDNQ